MPRLTRITLSLLTAAAVAAPAAYADAAETAGAISGAGWEPGSTQVTHAITGRRPRWKRDDPRARQVTADVPGTRTVGRLFSTAPDGTPSGCTATLVESGNRSLAWTAGHCVHSGRGGGPHTNFLFYPGLRPASAGGPAPYGVWKGVRWDSTRQWMRQGDRFNIRHDVGAIVLARDAHGRTATDVLGGAHKIAFRRTKSRAASIFGYPIGSPFTGESLYACGPNHTGRLARVRGRGPSPLVARCKQGPGSSGGPWIVGADGATGLGTVIGVTSATWPGHPWSVASVQSRSARLLYERLTNAPN